MRAHSSGRLTSFVTERDRVRWCKILHLTGCKILHLTGYDVSDAVRTTLALDISMSNIFLPHGEHIAILLERPIGECCMGKKLLFIARIMRAT
jgi:hypothetical protein